MQRLQFFLLLTLTCFSIAGCGNESSTPTSGGDDPGANTWKPDTSISDDATRLDACPIEMTETAAEYLKAQATSNAAREMGYELVRFEFVDAGTAQEGWSIQMVAEATDEDAIWEGPDYTIVVKEEHLTALGDVVLDRGPNRGGMGYHFQSRSDG